MKEKSGVGSRDYEDMKDKQQLIFKLKILAFKEIPTLENSRSCAKNSLNGTLWHKEIMRVIRFCRSMAYPRYNGLNW